MIEKGERMVCDGCDKVFIDALGRAFFSDVERLAVKFGTWVKDGDRHYCRDCAKERRLIK